MAMAMGISLLISLSIIETFCAVGPPGGYCASDLYMFTGKKIKKLRLIYLQYERLL
jgi:hypothetical protein